MTETNIAPKRTIVDSAHRKLLAVIVDMMTHQHAVARLSGGLRLTWDRTGSQAWFGLTRPSPSAPSAVEIETVRRCAVGKLNLNGDSPAWSERVERGDYAALWHGLRWELVVEEVKL